MARLDTLAPPRYRRSRMSRSTPSLHAAGVKTTARVLPLWVPQPRWTRAGRESFGGSVGAGEDVRATLLPFLGGVLTEERKEGKAKSQAFIIHALGSHMCVK